MNLSFEEDKSAHTMEVPLSSQYPIISGKIHNQMNTGENKLSNTFTPAAFIFPLPFTAVKLMEGYTATSYRMYPKGYNPLLSSLSTSFDAYMKG